MAWTQKIRIMEICVIIIIPFPKNFFCSIGFFKGCRLQKFGLVSKFFFMFSCSMKFQLVCQNRATQAFFDTHLCRYNFFSPHSPTLHFFFFPSRPSKLYFPHFFWLTYLLKTIWTVIFYIVNIYK